MRKLLFITVFLFLVFPNLAQDKVSKAGDYSESLPYQPRPENSDKATKAKKDKPKEYKIISESLEKEIPVYVFEQNSKQVTDLKKEDFQVFLDNQEIKIEKLESRELPLNLILLLDLSASSSAVDNFSKLFVQPLIQKLVKQNKIKIIGFNETVRVLCNFTDDLIILNKAINKFSPGGGTSLYDAIDLAMKKETANQTVVLLLTDGVDTTSWRANYQNSLIEVEKNMAVVFPFYIDTYDTAQKGFQNTPAIGGNVLLGQIIGVIPYDPKLLKLEYEIGKNYLLDLTAISGGRNVKLNSPNLMTEADFDYITQIIKPQYFLTFKTPNGSEYENRMQIKIRVNRPSLLVKTRGSLIITKEKK